MSVYIIAPIIVVLLIALVGYVFTAQYLEKKRAQQQRLLMTLKTRYRNITHMVSGFPPYFLPGELISLIYATLIDICQQLKEMEPDNNQHADEIQHLNNKLEGINKNHTGKRVILDSPQQMKEVRHNLQGLQHFVAQQEVLKTIDKSQSADYMEQINALNFQMTIDEFIHQAKIAQQTGKLTTAIHYFNLAKTQLEAENANLTYDHQIAQLDEIISQLEAEVASNAAATVDPIASNSTLNKEWEAFEKLSDSESSWQKKQAYD